ncbi:3-phenylpropionate MFS transporter, partial [Yersinia pestis]
TVISGFLFENYQSGVFWVMALIVIPALFIRPRVAANPNELAS